MTAEMAIVTPVLFLVVFASVEFGRMNVIRHTVDNAAYEACRRGMVPKATAGDCEATANSIMNSVGAQGVEVVVNPSKITNDTEQLVVTVSVDAGENGFIAPKFFSGKRFVGITTLSREQF